MNLKPQTAIWNLDVTEQFAFCSFKNGRLASTQYSSTTTIGRWTERHRDNEHLQGTEIYMLSHESFKNTSTQVRIKRFPFT